MIPTVPYPVIFNSGDAVVQGAREVFFRFADLAQMEAALKSVLSDLLGEITSFDFDDSGKIEYHDTDGRRQKDKLSFGYSEFRHCAYLSISLLDDDGDAQLLEVAVADKLTQKYQGGQSHA